MLDDSNLIADRAGSSSDDGSLQAHDSAAEPVCAMPAPHTATIRARAIILAFLLIPLLIFWVEFTEIVARGPDLAAMSMPIAAMFALMVIVAANILVRRRWPQHALTQPELMTVYVLNTIGVYIGGIGMMQFLTPLLAGWRHFATPSNHWEKWFPYVRTWAMPTASVVPAYYAGHANFFTAANFSGWASAIVVWSAFIFVLLFCMYCIVSLLRRQWVESERLAFPILLIPLEITRGGGDSPIWSKPALWIGFGIACAVEALAIAHYTAFPEVPYIPIKVYDAYNIGAHLTTSPLDQTGTFVTSFYPLVIGLGYLLSLDLSFSCWFFYLLTKLQLIVAVDLGATPGTPGQPPLIPEQAVGAFIGLALYALWLARTYLKQIWQSVLHPATSKLDDSAEPMSYPGAIAGFAVSAALLIAFGVALGLSLWTSLVFFGILLLFALAMTRIRAEAGLPWGQAPYYMAHGTIINFGGTINLGQQQTVGLTFLRWFDADWRCLVQPAQFEAAKAASATEPPFNQRQLTRLIMVAVVVALVAAWASCLGLYYAYGADSAIVEPWRTDQGRQPFSEMTTFLAQNTPMDGHRIGAAAFGLGLTLILGLMRSRFFWWPFHPIGYAVAGTETMSWIWCPILIAWALKALIVRYGGAKGYYSALPFFIGLVLGDYAISGVSAILSVLLGHPSYRTFPI